MDIGVPIRSFGKVDMEPLGEAILACDAAAWNENIERQKSYEVHEQTRSIVLLFADVEEWPAVEVSKQPGWDRLAEVAVPVMHEIIRKWYPPGGTIIRAMAAKLLAGGRILPHRDSHPSFAAGHRIHVPIVTNPARALHDRRPALSARGRSGLRDQQPESAQRDEQGQGGSHQFHLRLRAAGGEGGVGQHFTRPRAASPLPHRAPVAPRCIRTAPKAAPEQTSSPPPWTRPRSD